MAEKLSKKELLERIDQAAREGATKFILESEGLTSVPAQIGELINLRDLRLSNNKLTEVPAEIGRLKNLTRLWLGGNHLTSLSAEIGQLKNLTELCGYYNRLTSIPAEIGHLKMLTMLDLDGNQLTELPSDIGQLANLTELDLRENQLTELPAEIGNLTKLTTLDLQDNPLDSPPAEVIRQGSKAVLAYLREQAKGAKKRYEAKILLLGDGGEGKTCVSRALRGLTFKKQVRTLGVEVKAWPFAHPDYPKDKDKRITLNVWDFEGQEINHQSHQFFLTEKSLYLLVFNGRRQFKLERAEYWLDTIRARAPGSRVVFVATECEKTTPSWPFDKLKADYDDLLQGDKWHFEVGCAKKNDPGINNLRDHIQRLAADMDLMGTEWPQSFERAEEAIKSRSQKEAHVSRQELYKIFADSGISQENFEYVAKHMATLGVVTQFSDCPELEDFVVLNPQWLTKAISLVMEDKQLKEDKGQIQHKRMKNIWDRDYKGLYPVFHNCMKEFELCYDMEDEKGSLVPLRFGSIPPEIPWSVVPNLKDRRVEYKLNIRAPYGLMSRFIVKTHYLIAKTADLPIGVYWHNGVFLQSGEGERLSEALCAYDEDNRILSIHVKAAFPQNMIEQLHWVAKKVFVFFKGLEPERSYGCVKLEEDLEKECKGIHLEEDIIFSLSRNREINCAKGWHLVDPKRLVYGFSSFGENVLRREELRAELDKQPEWAEGFAIDVVSSLDLITKTYDKVVNIWRRQETLVAEVAQEVQMGMRQYLQMFDEMLDNRQFNSAPAIVSIVPMDGSKFNPGNWFNQRYVLTPYCECEGSVHKCKDAAFEFKMPRTWWEKTAPKLALGMKVLSVGLRIGFAGLPVGVPPEIFEAIKNEVSFMNELAGHLELKGVAESDVSGEGGEFAREARGDVIDYRQKRGEDSNRMARMQLAQLLEEIAPKNYKARQWGSLRRVRMPDNTYRWLCAEHAEEYAR